MPHALTIAGLLLAALADEPRLRSDPWKVPPGTVIYVTSDPNDPALPANAVVLSPDEWRRQIEQARRDAVAASDRVAPPGVCRSRVHLEAAGDTVLGVVRVEYLFRTTAAGAKIALGLKNARFRDITLDGRATPDVAPLANDAGWALTVAEPGEHVCRAEAVVAVAGRGPRAGGRVIEFSLPEAPVTALERLDLGPHVRHARVAGRAMTLSGTDAFSAVVLGPLKSLEITWTEPGDAGPAVLDVEQTIDARCDERTVTVAAKLTVRPVRGVTGVVLLAAPPSARVTADPANGAVRVSPPSAEVKRSTWELRREPSAEDWLIDIEWTLPVPKKPPLTLSGVTVVGAARHRGGVALAGPANTRAVVTPKSDAVRRAADDGFQFATASTVGPLLDVEWQPVRGELEVQSAHQLALTGRGWKAQARFEYKPIRVEVGRVEWELPAEWSDVRIGPPELVEAVTAEPGREPRVVVVRLAEVRRKPFTLTFEGIYPVARNQTAATVPLPHPVGGSDRGGTIGLSGPDGANVAAVVRSGRNGADKPVVLEWPGRNAGPTAVATNPARVDLTWRTGPAAAAVRLTADVEIVGDRLVVRQALDFGKNRPGRAVLLRGADQPNDRVRQADGTPLTPLGPGEWLAAPPADSDGPIRLILTTPFGAESGPLTVPLVWPVNGPAVGTVRVATGDDAAGLLVPRQVGSTWPTKPVSGPGDNGTWPALELEGTEAALVVAFDRQPGGDGPTLVIDRVEAKAVIDDDGSAVVRATYRVRPGRARSVPFGLPVRPADGQFTAVLDGSRLAWRSTSETVVELPLPGRPRNDVAVLELAYRCPPGVRSLVGVNRLPLPRPEVACECGPVTWQVLTARDRLLLDPRISARVSANAGSFAGDGLTELTLIAVPRGLASVVVALAVLAAGLWTAAGPVVVRGLVVACGLLTVTAAWPQPVAELARAGAVGGTAVAVVVAWRGGRSWWTHRPMAKAFRRPESAVAAREPSTVDQVVVNSRG